MPNLMTPALDFHIYAINKVFSTQRKLYHKLYFVTDRRLVVHCLFGTKSYQTLPQKISVIELIKLCLIFKYRKLIKD